VEELQFNRDKGREAMNKVDLVNEVAKNTGTKKEAFRVRRQFS
jgi:hypothetical protein